MADLSNFNFEEAWRANFQSEPPKIFVALAPLNPRASDEQNQAARVRIAAARTCYSKRLVTSDMVTDKQSELIGLSTFLGGHHTVIQHGEYDFAISGVSRQLLWSLLHAHPFYNSEQRSQRYTKADEGDVIVPKLKSPEAQQLYQDTIRFIHSRFHEIKALLMPVAEQEYLSRFPGRKNYIKNPRSDEASLKKSKKYKDQVEKKAEEIARYVLPIGTKANLYHDLSSLSLARLYRVCNQPDSSLEAKLVISKLVQEVQLLDPETTDLFDNEIPYDELLENKSIDRSISGIERVVRADSFVKEFDRDMELRKTLLTDYMPNAEHNVASAVREVLGLTRSELSDFDAINKIMDPRQNSQLADTLSLSHTKKLERALNLSSYVWKMRLSHTADSQEQRQRMTPGSRPIMECTVPSYADYEIPTLIRIAPADVIELYATTLEETWKRRNQLIEMGESIENANLLLPNAVKVRYRETSNLLNFMIKSSKRSCLNAQEEIWAATVEQIQDIQRIHNTFGKYLGPPCESRYLAGRNPPCPEGDKYCGVPVWKSRDGKEDVSIHNLMFVRTI